VSGNALAPPAPTALVCTPWLRRGRPYATGTCVQPPSTRAVAAAARVGEAYQRCWVGEETGMRCRTEGGNGVSLEPCCYPRTRERSRGRDRAGIFFYLGETDEAEWKTVSEPTRADGRRYRSTISVGFKHGLTKKLG
jgi:hypothetical protein